MTLIKKLALTIVLLNVLIFLLIIQMIFIFSIMVYLWRIILINHFWQSAIQWFQFLFIIFFPICRYIYFQVQKWYGLLKER